jgi:hypothetical protein
LGSEFESKISDLLQRHRYLTQKVSSTPKKKTKNKEGMKKSFNSGVASAKIVNLMKKSPK